jgi:hypothetical protein
VLRIYFRDQGVGCGDITACEVDVGWIMSRESSDRFSTQPCGSYDVSVWVNNDVR